MSDCLAGAGAAFQSNRSDRSGGGAPPPDTDDMSSLMSYGVLNEIWTHTDLRDRGAFRDLGSLLRRQLLIPLVTALYTGRPEATAVALRELVHLTTRLLPAGSKQALTANDPRRALLVRPRLAGPPPW
jgi:hypothetical protein